MIFTSDNGSGVSPEVLAGIVAANSGMSAGYGADAQTARAVALIRETFEAPEAAVYFVATGTAANALAIATLTPPYGAVFCHEHAHIEADECGAPEFFSGGAKLVLVGGAAGRIDPAALRAKIEATGAVGVHGVQRAMVSITNLTEAGTTYSPEQVAEISAIAKAYALPLHMDGARFANALAHLGGTPADLTWRAGVDCLSFGGTKNGCLGAEAVVFFDPAKAWEFELRRKRGGHLLSKHRYLGAQMAAYLEGGQWLVRAAHANAMAQQLAQGLAGLGAQFAAPVEGNEVFADLPRAAHRRAREAGAQYYLWPFEQSLDGAPDALLGARFVASWSTTPEEVAALLAAFKG